MKYVLVLLAVSTMLVAQQYGPPASGQTIKTQGGTYYNYYDQNGNPYLPGQPMQGTPYRSGNKILYDNSSNYDDGGQQSMKGPPGAGQPYRENGKIIYR